jgi:hypothetical protein
MQTARRLRFVTSHYTHLQGLRLVPLAVPFLISAAWRSGQLSWVPGTEDNGSSYWFVLLMALAVIAAGRIGRYYREHFGHVQPIHRLRGALGFAVFLGIFLFTVSLQQTYHFPISLPATALACGIGYVGMVGGEPRAHYLALAALCCIFATLGTFGVPFTIRDVLLDQLTGVGLIVVGVGDHLLLRRTLEPVTHVESV